MPPRKRARKVSNEADTVKLETELEQLTCEQLRQELLDIGENPGPIDLATKQVLSAVAQMITEWHNSSYEPLKSHCMHRACFAMFLAL